MVYSVALHFNLSLVRSSSLSPTLSLKELWRSFYLWVLVYKCVFVCAENDYRAFASRFDSLDKSGIILLCTLCTYSTVHTTQKLQLHKKFMCARYRSVARKRTSGSSNNKCTFLALTKVISRMANASLYVALLINSTAIVYYIWCRHWMVFFPFRIQKRYVRFTCDYGTKNPLSKRWSRNDKAKEKWTDYRNSAQQFNGIEYVMWNMDRHKMYAFTSPALIVIHTSATTKWLIKRAGISIYPVHRFYRLDMARKRTTTEKKHQLENSGKQKIEIKMKENGRQQNESEKKRHSELSLFPPISPWKHANFVWTKKNRSLEIAREK